MATIQSQFIAHIHHLQDKICQQLEAADGEARFVEDHWERPGGGGGRSRVMSNGRVFEKGGVSTSIVHGELPAPVKAQFQVDGGWFLAAGISLVIHPESPMVPTVHANWRYFELYDHEGGDVVDCWFGGGADLTPYYLWEEDAIHFHQVLKAACDAHHPEYYPRYKQQCDEYFYNAHRQEARGIGGLFFDYLRPNADQPVEHWFDFVVGTSEAFLPAYVPIVERRMKETYNSEQKYFQEIRRGRYVEFNLIHDKGTLFGLRTNGRTESILMSLPPTVRWDYGYTVPDGSREAELLAVLTKPRNWV
jgi:coproporphyrinogen III oxidase